IQKKIMIKSRENPEKPYFWAILDPFWPKFAPNVGSPIVYRHTRGGSGKKGNHPAVIFFGNGSG
ncbi:MAG: hypothetical protein AAF404_07030, partial [Pseudomonadota bacterium]